MTPLPSPCLQDGSMPSLIHRHRACPGRCTRMTSSNIFPRFWVALRQFCEHHQVFTDCLHLILAQNASVSNKCWCALQSWHGMAARSSAEYDGPLHVHCNNYAEEMVSTCAPHVEWAVSKVLFQTRDLGEERGVFYHAKLCGLCIRR